MTQKTPVNPQIPSLNPEIREELFQIERRMSLFQLRWMLDMAAGGKTYSSLGCHPPKQGLELTLQNDQIQLQQQGLVQLDQWGNQWSLTEKGLLAISLWMAGLHCEIQAATLALTPPTSATSI